MVMAFESMVEGIAANQDRQEDHTGFKRDIFDDIHAKQRQCRHKQRKNGAMNGTGHRSRNS